MRSALPAILKLPPERVQLVAVSKPLPASVPPDIDSVPTEIGALMLRVPLLSEFNVVESIEPLAKARVAPLARKLPRPLMLPVSVRVPPKASSVASVPTL